MSAKDMRLGCFVLCLLCCGLSLADFDVTEAVAWAYGALRTWTVFRATD